MSTTLTPAQVAAYAAGAGFRGDALVRAVAVALAESGGNPRAVGVNSDTWRSRDRGLWQINDHWHPEVTDAVAFSPAGNAAAAFKISGGGKNWSPWSTYKNGSSSTQMGRARMAVAQVGSTGSVAAPSNPTSTTAQNVVDFPDPGDFLFPLSPGGALGIPLPGGGREALGSLKDPLGAAKAALAMAAHAGVWIGDRHNWARVAMVTGGTVGLLIGVTMLAKSGAAGSTAAGVAAMPAKAAGVAATVVPIGKAATVAKAAASAGK